MGLLCRFRTCGHLLVGLCGLGITLPVSAQNTAKHLEEEREPFKPVKTDELSMTSLPGYPNAPAVLLDREDITIGNAHTIHRYMRIKVLTDKGTSYANVELKYFTNTGFFSSDGVKVIDVKARTIQPDGTIVPFTGKPLLKTFEKEGGKKYQAQVFTLPDVHVGSALEYSYTFRFDDNIALSPSWYLQSGLYTMRAHFVWDPVTVRVTDKGKDENHISMFAIVPAGTVVEKPDGKHGQKEGFSGRYALTVNNLSPEPDEDYMPPVSTTTNRVLFSYTHYESSQKFWTDEGGIWSKAVNNFMIVDKPLQDAVASVTAGATSDEGKLRKIYAALMAMENTDFTRDRGAAENKANGLKKALSATEVYKRGRGTSDQLTEVFVAMARAAGLKAYLMQVPNRETHSFSASWLEMGQFDNYIAIVTVDGTEKLFDPGQRYCEYGQLAWQSTQVGGMRQTQDGTELAKTPGQSYTNTNSQRVAKLSVDEHGAVSGTITYGYLGSAALTWRQLGLRGDEESVKQALREDLEEMLPESMEVKLLELKHLAEYDQPLIANFEVKGKLGTGTGKRLIVPVDIFRSRATASFPHEKREMAVYFHYPQLVQEVQRIEFAPEIEVEAKPEALKANFQNVGEYQMETKVAGQLVTSQRTYVFSSAIVPVKDYDELRAFFSKMETKDKESIVLKTVAAGGR